MGCIALLYYCMVSGWLAAVSFRDLRAWLASERTKSNGSSEGACRFRLLAFASSFSFFSLSRQEKMPPDE